MARKEAERDGATMFPEDNSLITDDNQELEPSEESGTIPKVIVTNESDLLRSQGSESQPQNPTMPCSIDMTAKSSLISSQESDPTLAGVRERILSESEAAMTRVCYYKKDGMLMRKWSPLDMPASDEWRVVSQIVVPEEYRMDVLRLAHEAPMAGHLGINKTYLKILQHFYWPGLKKDVKLFCRSCHTC